jgi:hypothetical protein
MLYRLSYVRVRPRLARLGMQGIGALVLLHHRDQELERLGGEAGRGKPVSLDPAREFRYRSRRCMDPFLACKLGPRVQPRPPLEWDEDVELLGLDQVGRRYDAGPVEVQWKSLWKSRPAPKIAPRGG